MGDYRQDPRSPFLFSGKSIKICLVGQPVSMLVTEMFSVWTCFSDVGSVGISLNWINKSNSGEMVGLSRTTPVLLIVATNFIFLQVAADQRKEKVQPFDNYIYVNKTCRPIYAGL